MRTLGFGEGRRPNRQSVRIGAKPRSTAEPIPPSPPAGFKPESPYFRVLAASTLTRTLTSPMCGEATPLRDLTSGSLP